MLLVALSLPTGAAGQDPDGSPTGPVTPCCNFSLDPLAPAQGENVPTVQAPPRWSQPVFWQWFDRQPSGSFAGTDWLGASVAVGGGRLYVASEGPSRVYMYDASTLAYLGSISVSNPVGIAYYQGELYVASRPPLTFPGNVRVYDTAGNFRRSFNLNTQNEQNNWSLHSLDVAWGEVWTVLALRHPAEGVAGNGELIGPNLPPAQVRIFDAQTGALKRIVPLAGHVHCEPTRPPVIANTYDWGGACPQTSVAPSRGFWNDIAISPELGRGIVQRDRAVRRGPFGSVPVQDLTGPYNPEVLGLIQGDCGPNGYAYCEGYSDFEGEDAVWGMRHLLAVTGKHVFGEPNAVLPTPDDVVPRGSWIQEYELSENPTFTNSTVESLVPGATSELLVSLWRDWQPMQATSDTIRDVVFNPRDTTIEWSGPLTTDVWNRNTQTLPYVVSNADIYIVGARGERWLEPNRQTTTVELRIDGVLKATNSGPTGQFSLDTTPLSNGQHTLEVKAYLNDGRVVTRTNSFRVDNAPPTGELVEPENYLWGTVPILGTMADSHSGPANWQLEVQRVGNSFWQEPCIQPRTSPDTETGYYRCDWQTNNGAFPDGTYRIRARLTDNAIDAGNVGYSRVWENIEIHNNEVHEAPGVGVDSTPQAHREEPPETFNESPASDAPPDETEGDPSPSNSDLQCPANELLFRDIHRDYPLLSGVPIGLPTPELALQEFLSIPPRVPFLLFSVASQTPDLVSYVSRNLGMTQAIAYALRMQDGTWLIADLIGCNSYLSQFDAPIPVVPTTGNPTVDNGVAAAQQLGGFSP